MLGIFMVNISHSRNTLSNSILTGLWPFRFLKKKWKAGSFPIYKGRLRFNLAGLVVVLYVPRLGGILGAGRAAQEPLCAWKVLVGIISFNNIY